MSSDIRNDDAEFAHRFVDDHKGDLKYLYETKEWIAWKDGKWSTSSANRYSRANRTADKILDQAKDPDLSNAVRNKLCAFANRYRNTGNIDQSLKQAQESLGISLKAFDADPCEINCKNGLLNLKTKKLSPHSGQLVLKQTTVAYNPKAECPRWLTFLSEIFEGNEELIEYVRMALGYSITGLVDEHCFFLLYGRGRNGKDKLIMLPRKILGNETYAREIDFEVLLAKDQENVRVSETIGNLRGLRLAQASETQDNKRFSEALMKRLTGGNALNGAVLRGSKFTFEPTHKLWLACNHLPAIKDATDGMWERVRVIPFNKQFLGDDRDTQLEDKLLAEREGIFAWLVEAAHDYLSVRKLPAIPRVCIEAVQEYRDDNDTLSTFIRQNMVKVQGAKVGVKATHEAYQTYCFDNQIEPRSLQYFRRDMKERGVLAKENRNKSWEFQNYRLATDQPEFDPHVREGERLGASLTERVTDEGRFSSDIRKIMGVV